MTSLIKSVLIFALVAATSAQICCNLDQECHQNGQICNTDTECYWDQRFAHICAEPESGLMDYRCYEDKQQTFWEAEEFCNHEGGTLARKILRDQDMVWRLLQRECAKNAWVGYRKVATNWEWIDEGDSNYDLVRWNLGQPDNYHGNENCSAIIPGDKSTLFLEDGQCFEHRNTLCEFEVPTSAADYAIWLEKHPIQEF